MAPNYTFPQSLMLLFKGSQAHNRTAQIIQTDNINIQYIHIYIHLVPSMTSDTFI